MVPQKETVERMPIIMWRHRYIWSVRCIDHMVKFCMHTLYRAEENLEKYAKYMSEADQRLVAQDIVERMKLRAPECKRGDDYDHFAGWIRRLYNSSPECEKIAREVAEEIVKENPNKAFRRMFERIGVM